MKRKRTAAQSKNKPDVATRIKKAWTTIEKHLTKIKSPMLATLNPPATEEEIKTFETKLGRPLPLDFRTCYLIHNGQSDQTPVEQWLADAPLFPLKYCETHNDSEIEFLCDGILDEEDKAKEEEEKKAKKAKKEEEKKRGKGKKKKTKKKIVLKKKKRKKSN